MDSPDEKGLTPLHSAASNGHLDVVKLLLESGADINIFNDDGKTALDLASDNGMLEVASFLSILVASQMSSDAVVKPSTSHLQPQNKPLNTVQLQRKDGEKAKPLNDELPPLYTASKNGQLDIVRSLLDRGFDVNEKTRRRNIALHGASFNGHLEVVKLLIECGSYVNSRNISGWTPLHITSSKGHLEVTRLLLDHGADVDIKTRNPEQWTPLHFASSMGHLDIALLLVERGADLDIRNASGRTARQAAMAHGQLKMAEFLSEHGTYI
ncbi:ankyrin repeat-containing domain protein [Lactarius psammicola]|nr:ankyrin repeat-containing domain protein [Lactarius psammicola]